MMGRGNALIFGKVALHSETATMSDLVATLDAVIAKHGYPEAKPALPSVQELEDELEEEDAESVIEEEGDGGEIEGWK